MIVKGIIDEDFVNYKEPSMTIEFPYCSFKCDKECGQQICQNSPLANEPDIFISVYDLIDRYMNNPITKAVVCQGLEPFDSIDDLYVFLDRFRRRTNDPVIIYTGYTEEELQSEIPRLQKFDNIIVKYGRFIPDSPHIFDTVLGVELASDNQYAKLLIRSGSNEYPAIDGGETQMEKHKSDN